MEIFDLEVINVRPILTELQSKIQTLNGAGNVYLDRLRALHTTNPFRANSQMDEFGVSEHVLPNILQFLGIRSITLNKPHDLSKLDSLDFDTVQIASEQYSWQYFRNGLVIGELQALFKNSRIIAFDDWSRLVGFSDLWSGLLFDVIRPIEKFDLEFIFYLGDPQHKLTFQVDEAVDIISSFSTYGQVTLALDEEEALNLWKIFNGFHGDTARLEDTFIDLKRKYISLYRTMSISRLLIYSANEAIVLSKNEHFVLARHRVPESIELAPDARQNFIAGYCLGLLFRLDVAHCIALGLVVFGSAGELNSSPARQDLLVYIDRWIEDIQKPETIYLYQ
ncbi:hypothetical protein [Spirosoma sp. KNUC1025]|uniref:hypothetical protein n=1 Tax=Spirosoma sp. KNUC1025 TaxID=2894082 RepID=UPI001E5A9A51|nr:hypothetical protein [Spirosoma sp. KNUC1025]UFH57497.1 hypothetical protein LN737_30805 [Spirosoma sp. KNUC1025]